MSKVLVTGGVGFIESHIAEYNLRKGEEIVVFNLKISETLLGTFDHYSAQFGEIWTVVGGYNIIGEVE